jgi:hypothetical protein
MERKRSWRVAGAFDGGHIRGGTPDWTGELDFHQLEISGHAEKLESDYSLFREEFGLTEFRDGCWLRHSFPKENTFQWDYLDRLADLSNGNIHLTISHYEWPAWLNPEEAMTGKFIDAMADFASNLAKRYRGRFAAYIPVVECGYWSAMISDWGRWWPSTRKRKAGSWYEVYSVLGRMMVAIAIALKENDPATPIELSEPWAWHPNLSFDDQARAFHTLMGIKDSEFGGRPDLLQITGLNFYNNWGVDHGWPLSKILCEARKYFPDQRIIMGETGNCHFSDCHSVGDWLEIIDEQVELANQQHARTDTVTWAPILTLGDFDWGKPAPGAWVTWEPDDPERARHWDPEVAKVVRSYTSAQNI